MAILYSESYATWNQRQTSSLHSLNKLKEGNHTNIQFTGDVVLKCECISRNCFQHYVYESHDALWINNLGFKFSPNYVSVLPHQLSHIFIIAELHYWSLIDLFLDYHSSIYYKFIVSMVAELNAKTVTLTWLEKNL